MCGWPLLWDAHGKEKLKEYYNSIGTRIHPVRRTAASGDDEAALAEVGLPAELADRRLDDANDEACRRSHPEGMDPSCDEVGTPVLHINGMALFGPVISPAPKRAGRPVVDGFALLTEYDGFFEAKRTRTVGPIFD